MSARRLTTKNEFAKAFDESLKRFANDFRLREYSFPSHGENFDMIDFLNNEAITDFRFRSRLLEPRDLGDGPDNSGKLDKEFIAAWIIGDQDALVAKPVCDGQTIGAALCDSFLNARAVVIAERAFTKGTVLSQFLLVLKITGENRLTIDSALEVLRP